MRAIEELAVGVQERHGHAVLLETIIIIVFRRNFDKEIAKRRTRQPSEELGCRSSIFTCDFEIGDVWQKDSVADRRIVSGIQASATPCLC